MMTQTNKFEAVCASICDRRDRDFVSEPLAVTVALDAAESRNPLLASLLVGVPVTWSIGSDCYGDEIAAVSASLHTLTLKSGATFRWNAKRKTYTEGKHRFLTIGYARDYRDPSF